LRLGSDEKKKLGELEKTVKEFGDSIENFRAVLTSLESNRSRLERNVKMLFEQFRQVEARFDIFSGAMVVDSMADEDPRWEEYHGTRNT
jgi:predicted nuclease with TOPRIM domain